MHFFRFFLKKQLRLTSILLCSVFFVYDYYQIHLFFFVHVANKKHLSETIILNDENSFYGTNLFEISLLNLAWSKYSETKREQPREKGQSRFLGHSFDGVSQHYWNNVLFLHISSRRWRGRKKAFSRGVTKRFQNGI